MLKVDIYNVKDKMDSKKYQLNKKDLLKIVKGAGIAVLGTILSFAVETIPNIDFGDNQWLASIVCMVLTNVLLKLNTGDQ